MDLTASYIRHFPGLAEAVAACRPTQQHTSLLERLRTVPSLESIGLAASRGDKWYMKRKVYTADGATVADDHQVWLANEVRRDGGDLVATCARLDAAKYRLGLCRITTLYLVAPGPTGAASDVTQIEVDQEEEVIDRELQPGHAWSVPRTLDALVREAEQGPPIPEEERALVGPPTYRLLRTIDVEAWLQAADALEDVRREVLRDRRYRVTSASIPQSIVRTQDDLDPGWDRLPGKHRRFFQDWERSSAGSHRLCDHWVLNLTDWTDPRTGHRSMELIPLWVFNRPLAKVDARRGSDIDLFGRLQKLDRRVGAPFAWFFYMVHGNRVEADAGERVIRAAEAGTIVLPECDYRVLKDWQAHPYGF